MAHVDKQTRVVVNMKDKYQEDFRVLVYNGWGWLSDEEGILQFYSEDNAKNYVTKRGLNVGDFQYHRRSVVNGEFSVEVPN